MGFRERDKLLEKAKSGGEDGDKDWDRDGIEDDRLRGDRD